MSVARFIADQRTFYRVPHIIVCALLGVSVSWFYKWLERQPTPRQQRRGRLDAAVGAAFKKARGLHGSPRLHADLRDAGWRVSEKTIADSMRRQHLVARRIKRRNCGSPRSVTGSVPQTRWLRLTGLLDDPDRTLTEPGIVPLTLL